MTIQTYDTEEKKTRAVSRRQITHTSERHLLARVQLAHVDIFPLDKALQLSGCTYVQENIYFVTSIRLMGSTAQQVYVRPKKYIHDASHFLLCESVYINKQ